MKIRTPWIAIAAVALLVGCSQPSENNENSDNSTSTNNTMGDMGTITEEDVDNSGAEYASEYETRFDSLQFTIEPGARLNGIVENNLNQDLDYPIVVLLEFTDFDAEAGTLTLVGGSGAKTGTMGVYEWEMGTEQTPTEAQFDPATGEFSTQLEQFDFIATFEFEEEVNQSVLPIQGLDISGQLALEDGGETARVTNGNLAGYVTKEDGDDVMIVIPGASPVSLTQLLKETTLNYDTTTQAQVDPGTGDAWYLEGVYTAVPTDIAD